MNTTLEQKNIFDTVSTDEDSTFQASSTARRSFVGDTLPRLAAFIIGKSKSLPVVARNEEEFISMLKERDADIHIKADLRNLSIEAKTVISSGTTSIIQLSLVCSAKIDGDLEIKFKRPLFQRAVSNIESENNNYKDYFNIELGLCLDVQMKRLEEALPNANFWIHGKVSSLAYNNLGYVDRLEAKARKVGLQRNDVLKYFSS